MAAPTTSSGRDLHGSLYGRTDGKTYRQVGELVLLGTRWLCCLDEEGSALTEQIRQD